MVIFLDTWACFCQGPQALQGPKSRRPGCSPCLSAPAAHLSVTIVSCYPAGTSSGGSLCPVDGAELQFVFPTPPPPRLGGPLCLIDCAARSSARPSTSKSVPARFGGGRSKAGGISGWFWRQNWPLACVILSAVGLASPDLYSMAVAWLSHYYLG